MKIAGKHYRSIWWDENEPAVIKIIDQEKLPFSVEIIELRTVAEVYDAICSMKLRGAPVIGAAAAFGIWLATLELDKMPHAEERLANAAEYLISSRPTAVNLAWAVNSVMKQLSVITTVKGLRENAFRAALNIYNNEIENCLAIGRHGVAIIEEISRKKRGSPVNILTHCNAGWLACIDYGTATSPVYLARDKKIPVHVWVDETRPRNQGARLTSFELENENIPNTLIVDNTGGHLMQHGMVDVVITGSDRTALSGDTANKIGTYLKALAAKDNNIPFYVAVPSSSIDFKISDGLKEIPVEERDPSEVTDVQGIKDGKIIYVRICPDYTKAVNFGFDITPARLISGLITERGICRASENDIKNMFTDKLEQNYGRGC
jgi:methylthioribose-1-phosphate isomerase